MTSNCIWKSNAMKVWNIDESTLQSVHTWAYMNFKQPQNMLKPFCNNEVHFFTARFRRAKTDLPTDRFRELLSRTLLFCACVFKRTRAEVTSHTSSSLAYLCFLINNKTLSGWGQGIWGVYGDSRNTESKVSSASTAHEELLHSAH